MLGRIKCGDASKIPVTGSAKELSKASLNISIKFKGVGSSMVPRPFLPIKKRSRPVSAHFLSLIDP